MSYKVNKTKLLKRTIMLLLVLACASVFIANRFAKQQGFSNLVDLYAVYTENKNLSENAVPTEMTLLVEEEDYAFLSSRRDVAMERGIQINDDENAYVACKIICNGDTTKGEMRLKGHMTDHLEGDKWSFRVKTKKNEVLGMNRFSLQAPGTRNYAYEWVYHQLLKEEGIIHLQYDFIRLKLNDKDLGIYALEEHFGQHVLENNKREDGAILRWNPNLYWDWRIDELQGNYLNQQYASYAASFSEPFDGATVEDDSALIQTYLKGSALLESFRRGEKTTSEVFDVALMAKFHAIIDLVGGHHSLDWSDVKFYYNGQTGLVEPVGYESFSVRSTEMVAGQRVPDNFDLVKLDYHDRLFSDPVFFEAYIKELNRICEASYFRKFIDKIRPELNVKLGILGIEFPFEKFSFDPYFENINLIRNNLDLPKPFHAFLQNSSDSVVTISVTPVSDFPIEILSLTIDDKEEFRLDEPFILAPRARDSFAPYFDLLFRYDGSKLKKLKLKSRIPGSENIFETEVSDLPSYQALKELNNSGLQGNSIASAAMAMNDSVFFFEEKNIRINENLAIGKNQTLLFFPGQRIEFASGGQLNCHGTIELVGGSEEGETIKVLGSGESPGIVMNGGTLISSQVHFEGCSRFVLASNESQLLFKYCTFSSTNQAFCEVLNSSAIWRDCASGSLHSLGIFDRSIVRIAGFSAHKGDVFLVSSGSDVKMNTCEVVEYRQVSDINHAGIFSCWASELDATENIVRLNHASVANLYGSHISGAKVAFELDQQTDLPGTSSYLSHGGSQDNIGQMVLK